jgi:hypothetical protein
MNATTSTIAADAVTDAPAKVTLDRDNVIAAYTDGKVTYQAADKFIQAGMRASVRARDGQSESWADLADELDRVKKSAATSTAKTVTGADLAALTYLRVRTMGTITMALAAGEVIPADVKDDMKADYLAALEALVAAGDTSVTVPSKVTDETVKFARRPVRAQNDLDLHFAEMTAGRGTLKGQPFTVEPGRAYTYATLASVVTAGNPGGDVSHGAVGMRFSAKGTPPAGWAYAANPTAKAANGARLNVA